MPPAGQTPGLLGSPPRSLFQVERDPSTPDFRVAALDGTADLAGRANFLRGLDASALTGQAARARVDRNRALTLIGAPEVRSLFEIEKEPHRLRDRYGRHRLGQSLLLAQQLVEFINFVAVFDGQRNGQDANWDSHEKLFSPDARADAPGRPGVLGLVEDLRPARAPRLDTGGALRRVRPHAAGTTARGRDHWPDCYTAVLAGGGVRGGTYYGSSDKLGAYPDRRRHARRPGRDDLQPLRPEPCNRAARHDRPPILARRGATDSRVVWFSLT